MISNRLKELIAGRKMTVYRFWKETGISASSAYRMYRDREAIPDKRVLEKICSTYQIQPGDLLQWEPNPPPTPAKKKKRTRAEK